MTQSGRMSYFISIVAVELMDTLHIQVCGAQK